jgi:hypothetical protein
MFGPSLDLDWQIVPAAYVTERMDPDLRQPILRTERRKVVSNKWERAPIHTSREQLRHTTSVGT